MFDFLFKKQIEKINRMGAEVYDLRLRVKDLEGQYHNLNRSVEQDKNVDRRLHEINSDEIKMIKADVEELKSKKKTTTTRKTKKINTTKETVNE